MRVLLVERFYWPDQRPHAVFFREIAERWAADGHDVVVLTARVRDEVGLPTAGREARGGVEIRRVRLLFERRRFLVLRAINMVLLMLRAMLHVIANRRYDVVFCSTMPPVVLAAGARVAARLRGSAFLYQMMDVHPEAGVAVGVLRRGLFHDLLRRIDTTSCRRASRTVVLSEDMKRTLEERGVPAERILVRNNYLLQGDGAGVAASAGVPLRQREVFRVLFAGNMGRAQGLEEVVDAALALAGEPAIQFHFVGGGLYREELERRAGIAVGETVHFHGMVPIDVARAWMNACDLGVVSIQPGVYRTSYPSKTATYLHEGLPILLIAEPQSGIARMVATEQVGWRAERRDAESVAAAIRAAFEAREDGDRIRSRAHALAKQAFDRDDALDFWSDLLREVAA